MQGGQSVIATLKQITKKKVKIYKFSQSGHSLHIIMYKKMDTIISLGGWGES